MNLRNLFNILIYTFLMVVPLMPLKIKLSFLPLSSDFIIGGIAILIGMLYIFNEYRKDKQILNVFKDKKVRFLTIIILIFSFLSIFSIVYAKNKVLVISECIRFLEYVFIFYLILIIGDSQFIKRGLTILYCVMIIAGIIGIIQFSLGLSTFYESQMPIPRGRIYATFVNPNYWGAAVNMVIFYPIIMLVEKKRKKFLANTIIILIMLFNLALCFTRGAWIGFIIGLGIICVLKYRKLVSYIALFIMGVFFIPFVRNRFFSIFTQISSDSARIKLWKTGFIMFRDHFWTGVGNGNYAAWYNEYIFKYPQLFVEKDLFSVHNSYLKMLAELGIFGGILFVLIYLSMAFMIFTVFKNAKKDLHKHVALAFMGFWGAYLFHNFFNNLMFIPQLNVLVWVITAFIYKGFILENQEA